MDWATVFDGEAGQVHCPPGKTHHTGGSFITVRGTVKAGRADIRTVRQLTLADIRTAIPALATQTSIPISLVVYQDKTQRASGVIGTVTADTPLARVNQTLSNLRSNTRHAVDLTAGGGINNILITTCFRTGETPADLSRPLGHHDDINHGDWASGCFAFADRKGPNHRQKVQACLCGARNSSGDWAQTDSEAGYEYISDPGYRTTLGCTTN